MKRERQQAILQLIEKERISTQEELVDRLNRAGFNVTQATVSRDIRDLKLVKVSTQAKGSHYVVKPETPENGADVSRFNTVLQEAYLSSEGAGNLLVVKTVTGMAMAVAASIDGYAWPEVVGTIAGDDTIFLALTAAEDCDVVKDRLDRMVQRF